MADMIQPRCCHHPRRTGRRMPRDTSCSSCWGLVLYRLFVGAVQYGRVPTHDKCTELMAHYAQAVEEQDGDNIDQ